MILGGLGGDRRVAASGGDERRDGGAGELHGAGAGAGDGATVVSRLPRRDRSEALLRLRWADARGVEETTTCRPSASRPHAHGIGWDGCRPCRARAPALDRQQESHPVEVPRQLTDPISGSGLCADETLGACGGVAASRPTSSFGAENGLFMSASPLQPHAGRLDRGARETPR